VIRVLANEDSTHVFENNRLVATLNAGDFYENKNQTQHTMVTSDRPVLVAQYSKGFDNGDDVGDPMMIIVAPTEQFLTGYRFATPVRGSWHHYINLIVPTAELGSIRLDGSSIDRRQFKSFGLSQYSIAQIEVGYGTHVISCDQPFGLYSYGFGYDDAAYDAYGNGGGQSMEQVIILPDTIPPALSAAYTRVAARPGTINAVAHDDRLNDKGMEAVTLLDYDNMVVQISRFEPGAPQVPITLAASSPKLNGYARFRMRDRAGNTATYTVCARYDQMGDSLRVMVLNGDESCNFSNSRRFAAYFQYSGVDNHVEIPIASDPLNNPVLLRGNHGQPVYGFGAHVEQPYGGNLMLTGRAGFQFMVGNLYGYYPDSLGNFAQDGTTRIYEEFHLHRVSALLTLSPGAQYYFGGNKAYLFGQINLGIPIYTHETFTRTIQSPSDFVYASGSGSEEMYSGSGPSGLALMIAPEIGLGATVEIQAGWKAFLELGMGTSLTTISPTRDWTTTYLVGRGGATFRF
jgi:hypothetical protein